MNNIIISTGIDQRMSDLYSRLLPQFGTNGKNNGRIQTKVVRAFGVLANNGPGPQIQICQLQANPVGGTIYPAQQLVQQTDAFIFCGMKMGLVKATSTAALKSAVKYTYSDLTVFAGSGEPASTQSFFSGGLVSLIVNTDPVMQPLAISYFENVPQIQSGAAARAANPTYNDSFQLLQDDFGVSGGNQNYFSVDLTNCDTAAISPSGANYAFIELLGFNILNANSEALQAAKANQLCL